MLEEDNVILIQEGHMVAATSPEFGMVISSILYQDGTKYYVAAPSKF